MLGLADELRSLLAAREGNVPRDERFSSTQGGRLERLRLQCRERALALRQSVPASYKLELRLGGLLLKGAPALKLGPQGGGTHPDRRQGRIKEQPDPNEFLGRAGIENREQRRPLRHDRKGTEQGAGRSLLAPKAVAANGQSGGDQPGIRIGGADPCLGRLDRLGRGQLLRAKLLGFVPCLVGDLLEAPGLGLGGPCLGDRLGSAFVERVAARLDRAAGGGKRKQRDRED